MALKRKLGLDEFDHVVERVRDKVINDLTTRFVSIFGAISVVLTILAYLGLDQIISRRLEEKTEEEVVSLIAKYEELFIQVAESQRLFSEAQINYEDFYERNRERTGISRSVAYAYVSKIPELRGKIRGTLFSPASRESGAFNTVFAMSELTIGGTADPTYSDSLKALSSNLFSIEDTLAAFLNEQLFAHREQILEFQKKQIANELYSTTRSDPYLGEKAETFRDSLKTILKNELQIDL